jgi:LPS-assembly protein
VYQVVEGRFHRLRGAVKLETGDSLLTADEVDYNDDTKQAEARGNVVLVNLAGGERLECDRAEYNLATRTGKFHGRVRGSSPAKLDTKPGLLATENPFIFQGDWAERNGSRYLLHEGFVTSCRLPQPTWVVRSPKIDIVPGDRAIARNAAFRLRGVPLFYTPYFYKSMAERPRKSGFMTPGIGNSSRRGKMIGAGYYWALNRSYDVTYRPQFFTDRGFAHTVEARGKPYAGSEFGATLYGVQDRGAKQEDGSRIKQGGSILSFDGKADLGRGFIARGEVTYLSSFVFRQAFTESFNEAVNSEVHSLGYVARHWNGYTMNVVFERSENFQSLDPGDKIVIRRLPALEFSTRERQISRRVLPVWVSLESSASLVRRNQPLFQTRQFVERLDFEPRITTALRWKEFSLLPSFSIRETQYGSTLLDGRIQGSGLLRSSREFSLELVPPSLARVFDSPTWLGERLKHVIEPRASFRHLSGVQDFDRLVRFDDTELVANTTEAEVSLVNRLYVRRRGVVRELASWQLWTRRFFDEDFGGAVLDGRRNVVASQITLTEYSFLDRARRWSPVVSSLRLNPAQQVGIEWRADYDPLRHRIVNSGISADARFDKYVVSIGHNHVRSVPILTPSANQLRTLVGWGRQDRPGFSIGFTTIYDFRQDVMQYANAQVVYNNDCCGISFQYRRFGSGTRNENQFRVAFTVANIGSFGTLRPQERIF